MYKIELVNENGRVLGMGYTDTPECAEMDELRRQIARSGIRGTLRTTPVDGGVNMDELGEAMADYQQAVDAVNAFDADDATPVSWSDTWGW